MRKKEIGTALRAQVGHNDLSFGNAGLPQLIQVRSSLVKVRLRPLGSLEKCIGIVDRLNDVLNQVYANVLGRPVLVPAGSVVSLGSAIFAFLAAGTFKTVEEAQDAVCPQYKVFQPEPSSKRVYDELYSFYSKIYFAFGQPQNVDYGKVLPALIQLSESKQAGVAH